MNGIEILEKLVSFNTIKDKENKEIIDWIANYLGNLGFDIKKIKTEDKEAIIAEYGNNINLTFVGHTDTVDISGTWNTDPFKLTEKEGNLYGLGSCDMKGGIAAFLSALQNIELSKLKKGIQLIITYDEELDFNGIKSVSKYKDSFADNILIGEPTELFPVIGTKGCIEYKLTLYGKASHSSEPLKGENAIIKCNNFINELLSFYEELKEYKKEIFEVPYTTMNIGKISGGKAINIVPEECNIYFDFRTTEEKLHSIIKEKISSLADLYNGELNEMTNIPPLSCSPSETTFLKELTNNELKSFNYVTEGSFLNKNNAFILGPGPNMAHQTNEYITKDSYIKTINIYEKIIKRFCEGEENE